MVSEEQVTPYGAKFLLYSSILSLAVVIIPALGVIAMAGTQPDITTLANLLFDIMGILAVVGVLVILNVYLLYRGWSETCLDFRYDTFCKVAIVVKYGFILSLLSAVGFIALKYSTLTSGEAQLITTSSLTSSPLLMLSGLSALAVWLSVAYAYYLLGNLTYINYIKFGGILTVVGPIIDSYIVTSLKIPALTVISFIMLTVGLRQLIQGVTFEEEALEEYEEVEEVRPKRPKRRAYPELEEFRYDDEYQYERTFEREREEFLRRPARRKRPIDVTEGVSEGPYLLGPRGVKFPLSRLTIIGRKDFVGLLPEEELQYISRRHLEIKKSGRGYVVRDLGSTNGTWVDGRRLEPGEEYPLREGSVIDLAEVVRLKFISGRELGVPSI